MHGKDEFLQAIQVWARRFKLFGAFTPGNASAGGSAKCSHKDLLSYDAVVTHTITCEGRDHIVNVRSGCRNLVVVNVHLELELFLRSLRERLRLITPHWPQYPNAIGIVMGDFNICQPEEGSMFGIRLSPTVTRERLPYFIPYFLVFLKLLDLTTLGEIPPSLGLYHLGTLMRCCKAWKPVGKCFDPISLECIDFQWLSQIVANLTRESLAELEAEIKKNFLGHRRRKTMRWPDAELDNVPGVPKKLVLCLTIFQARVEGPRHHQYENILRYVQRAPDDIRWTMDRTEFDGLIALKKDSAPGPDGIPYGAYKCAGVSWDPSSFSTLTSICWREVPFLNISLKVGRSLPPRPLTSMAMEGLLDHQMRFVH